MSRLRLLLVLVTGIVIGLLLTFAANVIASRRADVLSVSRGSDLPHDGVQLLAEILRRVETDYVEPVGNAKLMENAARGMVAALDPHSQFLDAGEYEEILAETAGSYPGIGIEVAATTRGVEVLQPIEGSPAAAAGLRIGDVIIAIDGHVVHADALEKAITDLRGPAGSTVHITIRRDGLAAPLDYDIRRAQVAVHSVAAELLEPGYGYLRIQSFNDSTAQDVVQALQDLGRQSRRELAGLVIDLRNNPGGLLESAVEIADDFLERGNIVSADGRTGDARFRRDAHPGDLLSGAPIAVIVNGNSASAAEILAGALKDNHRAELVGRRTYGKGSVQTVIPLSSGRALKLTTSRYFTPSGASINQVGIEPDLAYDGEDQPPAALDPAEGPRSLPQRDPPVALALGVLHRAPARAVLAPSSP
jgi:carboxyl-terminal processing protease